MLFKPVFEITPKTLKNIAAIERVKGFIEGLDLKSERIRKLQEENAVKESHFSTHIEGNVLSYVR